MSWQEKFIEKMMAAVMVVVFVIFWSLVVTVIVLVGQASHEAYLSRYNAPQHQLLNQR
jgi:CHASE1-domain containing sensor protein